MIDVYTWPTPSRQGAHHASRSGDAHNIIPIDIQEGDHFKPDFLKVSPNNEMPAIIDSDGPEGEPISVFESAACLIYLGEKFGRFFPSDPRKKYDVLQWLMFQMGSVGPMLGQCHHFNAYAPESEPKERLEYAQNRYINEGTPTASSTDGRRARLTRRTNIRPHGNCCATQCIRYRRRPDALARQRARPQVRAGNAERPAP